VGIKLLLDKSRDGTIEFILVGLEYWDDVDLIRKILVNEFGVTIKDILDGIWSRYVTLEKDGHIFELAYHEDIGIFFKSVSHPKEKDEYLGKLINLLMPIIEIKLNKN
jgi:hypothetical protein